MSALLDRAQRWVADVHPHARHLERTLDWLLELDPEASDATEIAAGWLREQGADPDLVAEVEALVGVHEVGGWPEADLVQAADSLSFLETMGFLVRRWPRPAAEAKLRHSL